jgi:glyoxylase-like metal-dependent hydrolase (beta-lactamase superfamily II)
MPLDVSYRDYESAGGIAFPRHIIQRQGGFTALELWVSSAQTHPGLDLATPASVRGAAPPPVRVESERIAAGVFLLTGGSHHSVAIEMRDHIVVVDAPLDDARSLAVIAKLGELMPGKPIRVVVNTHHHFDHAGGLRAYVDAGATVLTHEGNRAFFAAAWAAPRTLNRDRLAASGKAATLQTFTDTQVLTDGARSLEVHRIAGSPHADGLAMVYLPAEKILIEGDVYTPAAAPPAAAAPAAAPAPAGFPAPPPTISPSTINLYENIRRLKLDVARIAALHGPRVATMNDLMTAVGRTGTN